MKEISSYTPRLSARIREGEVWVNQSAAALISDTGDKRERQKKRAAAA